MLLPEAKSASTAWSERLPEARPATGLVRGPVKSFRPSGGYFLEPTCFIDVSNNMRIAREEIFGAVLVVIPYENDEDAIRSGIGREWGPEGIEEYLQTKTIGVAA